VLLHSYLVQNHTDMLGYVFVCGYVYVLLMLLVALLPVLGRLELSILLFYPHMTLQDTCINLKSGDCSLSVIGLYYAGGTLVMIDKRYLHRNLSFFVPLNLMSYSLGTIGFIFYKLIQPLNGDEKNCYNYIVNNSDIILAYNCLSGIATTCHDIRREDKCHQPERAG
jgi:hypothetical protein